MDLMDIIMSNNSEKLRHRRVDPVTLPVYEIQKQANSSTMLRVVLTEGGDSVWCQNVLT